MPLSVPLVEFSGLRLCTDASVYVPHEDSFLLADAARVHGKGRLLDVGCGTGIAGIAASLNSGVTEVVFADVNPAALKLAEENAKENKLKKKHAFVQSDLFSNLKGQQFDTICFNPPYLPTVPEEKLTDPENAAYDGGKDGRKVLDSFLDLFAAHLASDGVLLLLSSSVSAKDGLSGNDETRNKLEKMGFDVEAVCRQGFFFERLMLLKAGRV